MSAGILNEKQAAEHLNIAVRTLQWWRYIGRSPKYSKIGRLVRYRIETLDAFIDESERQSTSSLG